MINLTISGDDGEQFKANVAAVMAMFGAAAVAAPAAEAPGKPASTPRKKPEAKTEQAAIAETTGVAVAAEPKPEEANAGNAASTSTDQPSSDDGPHTIESVKKRAMLYTQSAGPGPLIEMLKGAGSVDGKFSQITEQSQIDRIADALAAMGF